MSRELLKGILTATDGKPITERSGLSSSKRVQFSYLPIEKGYQPFFYVDGNCESPGVILATDNIERLTDELFIFEDEEGRVFKLEVLK